MKVLIIEDELPAYRRISKMIVDLQANIQLIGHADSIVSAVALFKANPDCDLALMDIELADGQSFEIFKQVEVKCPVIFTTAYDEFALKAFKVNSIDYLLKPIDPNELQQAFNKFLQLKNTQTPLDLNRVMQALQQTVQEKYKERFLVKLGQKLLSIPVADIAYFQASEKIVCLHTFDQRKFVVDYSIEDLSGLLSPKFFFHLNRQFMANLHAIESVSTYFNGKLKIQLRPNPNEEVLVSRDKAADFKSWLNA